MDKTVNQQWNPEQYATNARFVADLATPVVELLAPHAGERILDLGCGDGELTRRLEDLGCSVVGIDASPEMIAAARALGLDARVIDGHAIPFEDEFDAVFSNATLHWMREPSRVIAGVWTALKPGGRFVAECGGQGNVATVMAALESSLRSRGQDPRVCNPWYFPSVDDYRQRLAAQGFGVDSIASIARPTRLPGSLARWLETFAQSFAAALPAAERADYVDEVAEKCRGALCDANGAWTVDYVRLRFAATKPAAAPLNPA